jgi:hypothetical protein
MSTRSVGWILFALFFVTLPFPAIGPFGGNAPALHHLALLVATGAIAGAEGAGGPIPSILSLFAIQAVAALLVCALAAGLLARVLALLPPRVRAALTLLLCGALLAASIAFDLYQTPFGRTPTSNLFGVLG